MNAVKAEENLYDLAVVGGGPAGLTAALYMARAKYRVLVLERAEIGGQITITAEIVNYPGVVKTSGKELTENMRRQAENFGAEFAAAEVLAMELTGDIKILRTTKGEYRALGVILATGANPRKLGFKGEREFQGRGVAYCATCDGEFFSGLHVFVIGGGFAAVEEGIFLTKYAKKVTIVVRKNEFSCAKMVSDQLENYGNIEVLFETELLEVGGQDIVTYARFRNNRTQKEWVHEAGDDPGFGVFVFAGYVPNTDWIGPEVKKDAHGYLLTDHDQKTNLDGVYAAGDVCVKNLRQVVTAVSDGAAAAASLEKVVSELHAKLGIPELVSERKVQQPEKAELSGKAESSVKAELSGKAESSVKTELSGKAETAAKTELPGKAETAAKTELSGKTGSPAAAENSGDGFLSSQVREQLQGVFAKFSQPVLLKAWLNEEPLSGEITGFLRELEGMSDKLTWKKAEAGESAEGRILPSIELCYPDGRSSGIQFHGVPGGHEFNSFVIALYNVAGPGQEIQQEIKEQIEKLDRPVNLKVLVSLSCTMCPDTVMAAQKAAAVSEYVEAEMFDLAHFPKLKEKYKVMSVPCMILNDEKVFFGKKGIGDLAAILSENGN